MPGGFIVLNAAAYQQAERIERRREKTNERVRRHRKSRSNIREIAQEIDMQTPTEDDSVAVTQCNAGHPNTASETGELSVTSDSHKSSSSNGVNGVVHQKSVTLALQKRYSVTETPSPMYVGGDGQRELFEGQKIPAAAVIRFPAVLDRADFKDLWQEWIQHRKEKKKPLQHRAKLGRDLRRTKSGWPITERSPYKYRKAYGCRTGRRID